MQMMSLVFWLMIVSMPMVVLPIARSPMMSSRWPRPSANKASITTRPVCTGWTTRSRSMIAGAGRSIGMVVVVDDRSLAVERSSERIDDAAEQFRPHRHAHDIAGAAHAIARLDAVDVVEQHAADAVRAPATARSRIAPSRNSGVRRAARRAGRRRARCRRPTSSTRPISSAFAPSGGGVELLARGVEPACRPARRCHLSCASSARISVEIGPPAVADHEMVARAVPDPRSGSDRS